MTREGMDPRPQRDSIAPWYQRAASSTVPAVGIHASAARRIERQSGEKYPEAGQPPLAFLLLIFIAPLCAQTPPLPGELLAAGAAYNRASAPQLAGWASYARAVTKDVYSFSTYEVSAARGTPFRAVTSTRTGFALVLRSLGPVVLLALADAGIAVAGRVGGTNVGGSFSGGGLAAVSLGRGWWVLGGVRQTKTALADAQPVIELGIGWGK